MNFSVLLPFVEESRRVKDLYDDVYMKYVEKTKCLLQFSGKSSNLSSRTDVIFPKGNFMLSILHHFVNKPILKHETHGLDISQITNTRNKEYETVVKNG